MKSPTVEDRDTSPTAQIATIIQEGRTTQETSFEVASRVHAFLMRDLTDAESLMYLGECDKLRHQLAAQSAQIALLREALTMMGGNVHYPRADGEKYSIHTAEARYSAEEMERYHKALAATPETASSELAELREKLRIAEGRVAIENSAREAAVEWRKKFASELQQLADAIIGGENVPAPFAEVLAMAEELRVDPARLEFLMAGGEVKVKQAGRNYSVISALHYRVNRADVDAAMHTQSLLPERLKGDAIIEAENKRSELAKLDDLRKDKARLDWMDDALLSRDPSQQLHKLRNGPMSEDITITMYNGRQTRDFTATSMRAAIDAAMQQGAQS